MKKGLDGPIKETLITKKERHDTGSVQHLSLAHYTVLGEQLSHTVKLPRFCFSSCTGLLPSPFPCKSSPRCWKSLESLESYHGWGNGVAKRLSGLSRFTQPWIWTWPSTTSSIRVLSHGSCDIYEILVFWFYEILVTFTKFWFSHCVCATKNLWVERAWGRSVP